MKHFIVELTYVAPMAKIDEILPSHRAFLQEYYDKGVLLLSGPQNPRVGGIVVARAESLEAVKEIFSHDPYLVQKAADYRFVEFNPVKFNPIVENWVK